MKGIRGRKKKEKKAKNKEGLKRDLRIKYGRWFVWTANRPMAIEC